MTPNPLTDSICYTIAFTLRSGSNLLCDYLSENGLGQPSEYFQYPFGVANRGWYDHLQVPVDDFPLYMRTLLKKQVQNGIFGTKLTWDHKNALIAEIQNYDQSVVDIQDIFPDNKFIYVFRKDKISQVVSLWRAAQTNSWTSIDQCKSVQLQYDFFQLLSHFQSILVEDYLWNDYFNQRNEPVKRVAYEDFIAQPRETIRDLDQYILQKASPMQLADVKIPDRLKVQRDEFSIEVKKRFLEDLSHIGDKEHWKTREVELSKWIAFFTQAGWK